MAPPKPTPKGKGSGLQKKVGPLPVWAWGGLALAAVGLFVLMRKTKTQESTGEGLQLVTGNSSYMPPAGAFSGAPAENSAPAAGLSEDVLWQLAGRFAELESRSTSNEQGLDQAVNSLERRIDQAVATATLSPPSSQGAAIVTATKPKPKPAPQKPRRYFTYAPGKAPKGKKANEIKLGKGQRLGYTKGKGYYAIG